MHEDDYARIQLASQESVPFVMAVLSLALMVICSAVGATVGSVKSASSAAMVANRGTEVLTKAYLPVLLASACFMYGFILTMVSVLRITEEITMVESGLVVAGTTIYGLSSLFTGLAIGSANKKSIVQLSINREMFLSFIIINSTLELPAVFSLIVAILLLS